MSRPLPGRQWGMYRSQGSGILSPGGADKALICGPIPGQASKVGIGTGSGDRPCLSIRHGQDQSPYALRDWRHWVPLYRLRTACPQQETLIRLRRGWRMSKGVFHRARKELWTWFPAWNWTDPRGQKKAPSSRRDPAEDKFLRALGCPGEGLKGCRAPDHRFLQVEASS